MHIPAGASISCFAAVLLLGQGLPLPAQNAQRSASEVLQHALHLADLYNWSDAADDFGEAEKLFLAASDQRNALHARLGKIRSSAEQRALPVLSVQLAEELDTNPLLQTDKPLRMFCWIVKGDIDGEIDSRAMREDWEQVQALARELGDSKWQNRALAQLGLAAFYEGDLATARMNVASALMIATSSGDVGAQIRYLTVVGTGLVATGMYEQAPAYFDKALKIAGMTPDSGYPFSADEGRLDMLFRLGKLDNAQRLADDLLIHAQQGHHAEHQAIALDAKARIARAQHDDKTALSLLEQSASLAEAGGFVRELTDVQSQMESLYRDRGDIVKAEQFAKLVVESTQASGRTWSVPQRLQTLAELQVSQGKYADAEATYDRAGAFVDSMIGTFPGVLDKTALIRASSEIYSEYFSLVAERLRDPRKAYSILEQVRGRVTSDLLMAGSVTSDEAKKTERRVAQLRLKLRDARSTTEVRRIGDQIFTVEQSRWVTPEISILKARAHSTVGIDLVQNSLEASEAILEYVVADPHSYCLVISHSNVRIVTLAGKHQIEALIAAYLKPVRDKQPAFAEARALYDVLLQPVPEAARKEELVVIRDGQLHLVPFDGLIDPAGRYVVETRNVIYAPSSTAFLLLTTQKSRTSPMSRTLLAVGGIPYNPAELKQVSLTRGYEGSDLSDLPASKDEVIAADAAVHDRSNTLLLGSNGTESAFKHADLSDYRIVHLAVHGFASKTDPNRSALVLLSDPSASEDGFLQASEIVQLRLNADLVILSACDTAVGPVEGEEGIATLSRAFLLAGAKGVVSTLWAIDDTFSLSLMKQFYQHLAAHEPAAYALTAAKRDMLRKFGREAVPYYWASFIFEGAADRTAPPHEGKNAIHATRSKTAL
jgi:CHAT domain-containing protein/tetratricopeptide (TPR) repeat protein